MTTERMNQLQKDGGVLTKDEMAHGWHFCFEWDELLTGPEHVMPEGGQYGGDRFAPCSCDQEFTRPVALGPGDLLPPRVSKL